MEKDIEEKLKEQDAKLDAIYISVNKTRKYIQLTFWFTIAMFVLPAIALVFVVPFFINTYVNVLGSI